MKQRTPPIVVQMNGSASKKRGGTNLDHHRALSLESVKDELARGRVQLAELQNRDIEDVDPKIVRRLEIALNQLENILRADGE